MIRELNSKELKIVNGGYRENNPGGGGNFAAGQNAKAGRDIIRNIVNELSTSKKKEKYRPAGRLGGYSPE